MRQRLSVVNLGVADLQRARKFYVDGLHMPARPESTERAFWIEMNKVWLGFFQREKLAELARTDPAGSGFSGVVLSHNVETKQEVDDVLQQAVAAGGKIARQPEDSADGISRIGYFEDLDGFRWEVAFTPRYVDLTWPDGKPGDVPSGDPFR
jgi:predicted lactoylglutathione lyase